MGSGRSEARADLRTRVGNAGGGWPGTFQDVAAGASAEDAVLELQAGQSITPVPNDEDLEFPIDPEKVAPVLRRLRLKHGNLTGPAGYVSLDDSEVLKQMQPVVENYADSSQVVEMHGKDHVGVSETSVSESMIRAFYTFYRREMGL